MNWKFTMQRILILVASIPKFQKKSVSLLSGPIAQLSPFKICYGSSISEDFGTSGFEVSVLETSRLAFLSNLRLLKFQFTYPPSSHSTTISTSTMASGTLRWFHVTYDNVIGSHHSRLYPQLTGTWYTHVSTSVQKEKSNG
jgi:hypothetical protein